MKAPEKIILEIDRENHCTAKVSFGDIRKRHILYDIYEIGEEQTNDNKHIQITKIKLMRIKDFKKEYNAASKKNRVLCEHCGFGTKDAGTKPETQPWKKDVKDTLRFCDPTNTFKVDNKLVCGHVYGSECEKIGCCKLCEERCNSRCHHSRKAGKR
jgi:hypothetical protein